MRFVQKRTCIMHYKIWIVCVFITIADFASGNKGFESRIIGGYEAPVNFGKIYASLQNLSDYHVCGGAIVSYQHVATAAHCVNGVDPQYIKIVVGTINLDVGGQQYDVESISIHPEYNSTEKSSDIAIMKVSTGFDSDYVKILKLYESEILEGDIVTLIGFGALEPKGDSSRIMNAINLTVFNQDTCVYAMRYTREVFDSMFCTFNKIGEGSCNGDSGGPLIHNNQLYGLASWGIPCAVGFPDVHTRITPYIDWIKNQINN